MILRQVTGKDYFNKGFASDHLTMIQAGCSVETTSSSLEYVTILTYVHAYAILSSSYLTLPSLPFLVDNASEIDIAYVIEDPTDMMC